MLNAISMCNPKHSKKSCNPFQLAMSNNLPQHNLETPIRHHSSQDDIGQYMSEAQKGLLAHMAVSPDCRADMIIPV